MRLISLTLFLRPRLLLSAQSTLVPVDETGYQKMLAANKGKVVLVDFWATYCVPCRAETPKLVALAAN